MSLGSAMGWPAYGTTSGPGVALVLTAGGPAAEDRRRAAEHWHAAGSTRARLTLAPLVAAALVLLGAGAATPAATAATAASAPTPGDAQGVVYPLTTFVDWAQNPASDLTNESLGEYALEQELDQAQSAVLTQDPQALVDALSGPNAAVDAEAYSEQMAAELTHLRPVVAGDDVTNMANPDFMPDFDHNGVYGDPDDFTAMAQGHATGAFLYPCIDDAGNVTYETTSGACAAAGTAGDTFLTGEAEQQTIIDSRGLALAATLWLPAQALAHNGPAHRFPAVVISDGIASDQSDYFWLAMSIAAQGDIVLTYDPAGQGASEGSAANLFEPSTDDCTFGGACRDLEDVVRWLLHSPITPVVNLSESTPIAPDTTSGDAPTPQPESATTDNPDLHDPAYVPQGENDTDPALNLINPAEVAVVGHSMGALSLLNYLWWQHQGPDGADGEPLPPLATGIALSGAAPTAAVVPIQFQTSDYDGSPTLIGPEVGGVDLGFSGGGIGYAQMKPLYDQLRTSGPGHVCAVAHCARGRRAHRLHRHALHHAYRVVALRLGALRHDMARLLPPGRRPLVSQRGDGGAPPVVVLRQRGGVGERPAPPCQPLHHGAHHGVAIGDAPTVRRRAGRAPRLHLHPLIAGNTGSSPAHH